MKKILPVLLLIGVCFNSSAQKSSIKPGANFNSEVISHKNDRLNYASFEVSYERLLGKKFSTGLSYNYANRTYNVEDFFYAYPNQVVFYSADRLSYKDHLFIPEV